MTVPNNNPVLYRINDSSERNASIDIVKGICILLMVMGHSGVPKIVHHSIYMFHMPCFFIVSGWLFKEKYVNDTTAFIKRRFDSLWKPYATWGLIYLCLANLLITLHISQPPYYEFNDYLKLGFEVLTMQNAHILLGGFWFIESLFVSSIIAILWYKFIGSKLQPICIGITVFVGGALAICYYNIDIPYIHTRTLMGIAYFFTGTLLSRIRISGAGFKTIMIIIAMIALGCGIFFIMPVELLYMKANMVVPYFIASTLISYTLIITCIAVGSSKHLKWLITLGRRSIDILIFHFLMFKIVSLIKIWHYGLPIERLSDFPIVGDANYVYWIVFVVFGVWGSMLLADGITIVRYRFFNFFHKYIPINKTDS